MNDKIKELIKIVGNLNKLMLKVIELAGTITLLVFMAIDYLMGLACAGIFQKSPKTESGGLQSKVGWKGLCRKVATLALVVVAVQVDAVLHTSYVRDGVCIAFMANELISMVENVGLMGVQFPEPLRKAIDLLQKKDK